MVNNMTELTIDDALIIIGAKEVEIFHGRRRLAKAVETIQKLQAELAEKTPTAEPVATQR